MFNAHLSAELAATRTRDRLDAAEAARAAAIARAVRHRTDRRVRTASALLGLLAGRHAPAAAPGAAR